MQTKLFPLFDDTNDVLRITHDTAFQYCKIAVNEREIGVIQDKKTLESGLNYDLGIQGGDNHLQIKLLKKYFLFPQLQVLVNGEAVENSDTYPETQFKWVMMAAFIPFLVGLNSFVYNFIFQTLFLSEIEKSYFFLVNIAILGLLYHFRTLWSLYLVIIFYTYSLFIQFLLLQTQLGDDQSYSTYNFIYWGFSTLVILLPILYLIAEGLPIIKTLKNNETNDNPTILDANQ